MDSQSQTLEPSGPGLRIEGSGKPVADENLVQVKLDIEHAVVKDDPRKWSKGRKYVIVAMISGASMIAGLGANIYNPAIAQIESDLHATASQLSLTLSLFILIQGGFPLIWSSVSEIRGRKTVYLTSIAICMLGCIVAATAKTINVLIGMRCLQAAGSSAVISIGAATLADLYEPAERGTMMGIYYCAPLLGPSLGPILGGVLTQGFNWRATFWFLAIFTGLCTFSFVFFRDTFRLERSLTYQTVLKRVLEQEAKKAAAKAARHPASEKAVDVDDARTAVMPADDKGSKDREAGVEYGGGAGNRDVEAQATLPTSEIIAAVKEVKPSLRDVNPILPILRILYRRNNVVILFASGLLFAFNFSITYTASRTLANEYHYDALDIGFVLLAYGIGCLFGSVLGGRYSDHIFTKLKAKHGGKSQPEARTLTMVPMLFFPPSVVAYGWVYANVGRSSSAVASNSFFRGLSAFVATEVAVPLQNSIGDGGLYSLWGGLTLISELLILLVWWKGGQWREKAIASETRKSGQSEHA
ncbi:major facilitator superfamily domain-containing protein [Fomitopsis serialis]|uniref:major facilitator superfamily domain-containing protein n=1 Tax=Fomitopsis serialis TaxID=139415 RepID=UPI0020082F02|nr:major facilitator superfamily domain-containing protein [Neoantrodia serialis]KAH9922611.1 major facilitator superfamily domain-containing protein [Neoantrodia serialis]